MPDNTSVEELRRILDGTRTIAMVGASTNPVRPSFFVGTYFRSRGRRVIPINPGQAGQVLFGETVLGSISEIPSDARVDMLDIFRKSDAVPSILDEALEHLTPHLKGIWMQYGVTHEGAAEHARAAGLYVVQDRCPKVEHMRLTGGLNPAGIKSGMISSKLPRLE